MDAECCQWCIRCLFIIFFNIPAAGLSGFYWVCITATTIGFGDLHPVDSAGYWFAIFYQPLIVMAFTMWAFSVTQGKRLTVPLLQSGSATSTLVHPCNAGPAPRTRTTIWPINPSMVPAWNTTRCHLWAVDVHGGSKARST